MLVFVVLGYMNLFMEKHRGRLKQDPWDTAPRSEEFQQTRMSEAMREVPARLLIMSLLGSCWPLKSRGKQFFWRESSCVKDYHRHSLDFKEEHIFGSPSGMQTLVWNMHSLDCKWIAGFWYKLIQLPIPCVQIHVCFLLYLSLCLSLLTIFSVYRILVGFFHDWW